MILYRCGNGTGISKIKRCGPVVLVIKETVSVFVKEPFLRDRWHSDICDFKLQIKIKLLLACLYTYSFVKSQITNSPQKLKCLLKQ